MGRYLGVRSPPRSLLNSKFSFSQVLHFVFNLDKSDCSRSTALLGCCCCSEVELAFLHNGPKLIISFGKQWIGTTKTYFVFGSVDVSNIYDWKGRFSINSIFKSWFLEPACCKICKKQKKKLLTSHWFVKQGTSEDFEWYKIDLG